MMGERSSPFVSGITVLLICAQLLCFSASQSTTCTMPSVEEGQATTLTVEFGFNLQDEEHHRDVIIKRGSGRGRTDVTEDLLDCYWEESIKDYRCKVKNHRFYFNDHITENMTLLLPNASKEDAGKYFIDVTGSDLYFCNFSLGDERSGEDGSNCSKARVTATIVVSLVLVLVVAGICLTKMRGKQSTLPCWSRKEAKESVQATDLGEKDSKDGEEENSEGEDATETDNPQELVDVRG